MVDNAVMQDRIDPLIHERAPWLFEPGAPAQLARRMLMSLLGYRRTVALAEAMRDLSAHAIMTAMAEIVARRVEIEGLEHLPARGPALVVCNHPTGIADGIVLYSAIARYRPDLYFFANHDILRILPQMHEIIAPVEWRAEKRTMEKTRATMTYVRRAVEAERLGIIFPSGRLAKRTGLTLRERKWMPSAAMLARRFGLPVVPIHLRARNSALFYLFDAIHPSLRDITLFHETLNKGHQSYGLKMGPAIDGARLPARSEEGIAILRAAVLGLAANRHGRGFQLPARAGLDSARRPSRLAG